MKKDNIYFDESGLTSTSANFNANLAKEYCQTLKEELNKISFVDSEIALIGGEFTPTGKGVKHLSKLSEKLDKIVQCNSLIAWFREAIKAKESLTKELNNPSFESWCEETGKEYPVRPESESPITKDDVLATWSVKDRNRYLSLATKASVYGKFIHPEGPYSTARTELKERINEPVIYTENGRDTIINRYQPSVDTKEVDTEFFVLQGIWRKAQAELNGYEHKIQQAIDTDTNTKNSEYIQQYAAYKTKIEALYAEFKDFLAKESQHIANLKIIIPHELEGIYNEITALSK